MKKKSRRLSPELNAGSMADIAFLMLIFFLVATTIAADKGILVKLPPWEDDPVPKPLSERNVLSVNVNFEGQILVEDKLTRIEDLKEVVKEHIANPFQKPEFAASPTKAIVSLINDRNTPYTDYIQIYDELKAAYRELWEAHTLKEYGMAYSKLDELQQKEVRNAFPQVISEAEPTDFKQPSS